MKVPSELPYPLALLRIVLPIVIVASPELYEARSLAQMPERIAYVPEGLGLLARIPVTPSLVHVLQIVALSSAATAALGWMSRASMLTLTLSAGFLFSLSQRGGAVLHDMHLFWLGALLAASPIGDVWSLDAWGAPGAEVEKSPRYGVPIALCRLLLGLVYFFPGLHKLLASGTSWVTSENVIHHMHAKWLEHGAVPFFRIDQFPTLCAIGAAGVVLFELSFIVLALASSRTRPFAIAFGLAFHAATQIFFFIPFVSLWAMYVVLLDGKHLASLAQRLHRASSVTHAPPHGPAVGLPLTVGALIAVAAIVQGIRGQTQAWPFACYPTFAHLQGPTIPDIAVVIEKHDGTVVTLTGRESQRRSQAEWAHVFRISGAYGDGARVEAVRDHARAVLRGAALDPTTLTRVRVFRSEVATATERWGTSPSPGVFLLELEPPF